ncbi:hypothetical protein BC937DRAFT_92248 [Endogone sp. FLAS-F59071]|nr:hypothetical protein BC937DRAFT_92248 [Endogone sp. FLAS-F59071]|eukprot:RUS15598.1 hypothetical protein BC937DRAFT_92248 [Endogone sp. FLAS-F59071]
MCSPPYKAWPFTVPHSSHYSFYNLTLQPSITPITMNMFNKLISIIQYAAGALRGNSEPCFDIERGNLVAEVEPMAYTALTSVSVSLTSNHSACTSNHSACTSIGSASAPSAPVSSAPVLSVPVPSAPVTSGPVTSAPIPSTPDLTKEKVSVHKCISCKPTPIVEHIQVPTRELMDKLKSATGLDVIYAYNPYADPNINPVGCWRTPSVRKTLPAPAVVEPKPSRSTRLLAKLESARLKMEATGLARGEPLLKKPAPPKTTSTPAPAPTPAPMPASAPAPKPTPMPAPVLAPVPAATSTPTPAPELAPVPVLKSSSVPMPAPAPAPKPTPMPLLAPVPAPVAATSTPTPALLKSSSVPTPVSVVAPVSLVTPAPETTRAPGPILTPVSAAAPVFRPSPAPKPVSIVAFASETTSVPKAVATSNGKKVVARAGSDADANRSPRAKKSSRAEVVPA